MKPHRARKKDRVPELRKLDALFWRGKPNIPVKEPQRVAGYEPEEIDRRINEAIAKGIKI